MALEKLVKGRFLKAQSGFCCRSHAGMRRVDIWAKDTAGYIGSSVTVIQESKDISSPFVLVFLEYISVFKWCKLVNTLASSQCSSLFYFVFLIKVRHIYIFILKTYLLGFCWDKSSEFKVAFSSKWHLTFDVKSHNQFPQLLWITGF